MLLEVCAIYRDKGLSRDFSIHRPSVSSGPPFACHSLPTFVSIMHFLTFHHHLHHLDKNLAKFLHKETESSFLMNKTARVGRNKARDHFCQDKIDFAARRLTRKMRIHWSLKGTSCGFKVFRWSEEHTGKPAGKLLLWVSHFSDTHWLVLFCAVFFFGKFVNSLGWVQSRFPEVPLACQRQQAGSHWVWKICNFKKTFPVGEKEKGESPEDSILLRLEIHESSTGTVRILHSCQRMIAECLRAQVCSL